jgi:Zn-dependent protease with chaperone function
MAPAYDTTAYRYQNEQVILWLTFFLVLAVIALTATATVCLSVVFILAGLFMAYAAGTNHHRQLVETATHITPENAGQLAPVIRQAATRLQVEPLNFFVLPSREINAYTFGLTSPKAIVIYQSLFQIMDREELQFIIGHEMGHVKLGHTWLNSLVGGMAGIPAPGGAALLLVLALRSWNRACEFSADRAGVLACANPAKAISALVKLEAGPVQLTPENLAHILKKIDAQDDSLGGTLSELLATHPMIVKRIDQIRRYMRSESYKRLQARMNENLASR